MPAKGVVDALTNTYTDVAKMRLLPDAPAHTQFLDGLEQGIMSYIQMQSRASLGQPGGSAAGIGGAGGGVGSLPPGMGASGPPPSPVGQAGPPGGGMPQGPMSIAPGGGAGMSGLMGGASGGPNPDELRRLLAAGPPG